MPDILLCVVGVGAALFCFLNLVAPVESKRVTRNAGLLALACGGWFAAAYYAPAPELSHQDYTVLSVAAGNGAVQQVISVDGLVLNVNQLLDGSVPEGRRVRRTSYARWRYGVYKVFVTDRYEVAPKGEVD